MQPSDYRLAIGVAEVKIVEPEGALSAAVLKAPLVVVPQVVHACKESQRLELQGAVSHRSAQAQRERAAALSAANQELAVQACEPARVLTLVKDHDHWILPLGPHVLHATRLDLCDVILVVTARGKFLVAVHCDAAILQAEIFYGLFPLVAGYGPADHDEWHVLETLNGSQRVHRLSKTRIGQIDRAVMLYKTSAELIDRRLLILS